MTTTALLLVALALALTGAAAAIEAVRGRRALAELRVELDAARAELDAYHTVEPAGSPLWAAPGTVAALGVAINEVVADAKPHGVKHEVCYQWLPVVAPGTVRIVIQHHDARTHPRLVVYGHRT